MIAILGATAVLGEELYTMQMLGGLILLAAITIVIPSTAPTTGKELAESAAETDAP